MTLKGKGLFIWKLHRIAGGEVHSMAAKARDAGLTHVIIKLADGPSAYNESLFGPATSAFRAAGIQVWGWVWLWLREPIKEAEIAGQGIRTFELDGLFVNAEHPAKGKPQEAGAYMDALRTAAPDCTVALSSYRYPDRHTSFPWREFLTRCDLDAPQMYWVGETPAECVHSSLAEHRGFSFARPVIPTGAAFGEQYGDSYFRAQPAEIVEFLDAVRARDLPAASFWSWDWAEAHGPDLWEAIAEYDWPISTAPDIAERFWDALVTGDLDALVSLYHKDAIYVTGRHSAQGPAGIRTQFSDLLDMLPEAQFHQEELRRDGSIRFLHWSATSAGSQVRRGRDTIGVRAGKIQYHSSSYRLVTNQENPAARDDSTSSTTLAAAG